ncbi:60S ribosomal protein l39-3 [Phtheirospermum japonicum]|uniref:60S ribosomal protein l39-3 n=1 Tax=Phtheirospermum japonicum TaxID=374723 RepID=A0A830BEY6_9LAMI|nr:60S ribosomal protein l39-3 [Phtheirospermum japonicum]
MPQHKTCMIKKKLARSKGRTGRSRTGSACAPTTPSTTMLSAAIGAAPSSASKLLLCFLFSHLFSTVFNFESY